MQSVSLFSMILGKLERVQNCNFAEDSYGSSETDCLEELEHIIYNKKKKKLRS
jgi:hypothetical protein